MFHILFISHGELAAELLKTAEMILGGQPREVQALSLPHGQDMDAYLGLMTTAAEASAPEGILILTDIMGGSPFMTATKVYAQLCDRIPMEIVTGMNLPMAIEVLSAHGGSTLGEAKEIAVAEGAGGVKDFVAKLNAKKAAKGRNG